MKQPTAVMIGADKGGVGKTMFSRIILDYINEKKMAGTVKVFDTEYPNGGLKRFYPQADIVDLENTQDQMKVLDNLADSISIIDIRAGLLSPTLKLFSEIGLFESVKAAQTNLVIFHILGPTITSLGEVLETTKIVEGAKYFLVKNYTNEARFFEWDPAITKALDGLPTISIPQLNEMAIEHIDQSAATFSSFINDGKNSFVLKGSTRHWLSQVYSEIDRINFREMV
jgi:hypothetical protein